MKAKIIHLAMAEANGLVYVTSPDLPGLYVSGRSREEVIEGVPEAIRVMFAARGTDVIVREVETDTKVPPWVAVPTAHEAA
ncbi:hypothetical protein [Nitratireductor sp. StC3]|uniref:type II toxin-antitoxin system HicB family antitoxin n=1 Tax=Nitratireductor sp. StC3 TaxID=2126741 RepID=UPI000D0E0A09|nr:hypothetical protein [Nitratireductor sp. StC3]PSM20209.1 hypothetical protein C7T96_03960 [Nitratireductor sp. StC3]